MTDEFGTKVALLVRASSRSARSRPIVDRLVPGAEVRGRRPARLRGAARPAATPASASCQGSLPGRADRRRRARPRRRASSSPAHRPAAASRQHGRGARPGPPRGRSSTFPPITIDQDVTDWNHEIAGPGAQAIALTLAENLELENQALLRGDASILTAVDHGDRLKEMQAAAGRREGDRQGRRRPLPLRFDGRPADRAVRRPDRAQPRLRLARAPSPRRRTTRAAR